MLKDNYVRSALFVDFDNIFIGFQRQQAEAADLFGTSPERWVQWLEREAPIAYGEASQDSLTRRILLRRCYINPRTFHEYRPHFIRSGFEVVDCPPLTAQGKTSADIHMVIDMLDALAHATAFDEFIVLSGDADFTPVLLRLRKHDRRTMMLAVGPASPAYKASSDFLLDESVFLEEGLGMKGADSSREARRSARSGVSESNRDVLDRISTKVEELANMTGRINAIELPRIYKGFPEFSLSENWLGFYSLRRMTEAVIEDVESLEIVEEDPWWVGLTEASRVNPGQSTQSRLPTPQKVRDVVKEVVAASEKPVVLAAVAQEITLKLGDDVRESSWLGAGSFKALVERLELEDLEVSDVIPGFVFDPRRHDQPRRQREVRSLDGPPPIARKISKLTGMPYLSTLSYVTVLEAIAEEVNENRFHLTETSKAVRDRCAGRGIAIARSHISFLLRGIVFAGHRFGESQETAFGLGEFLVRNTLDLCARAQVELDELETDQIWEWIVGDLERDEEPELLSPS